MRSISTMRGDIEVADAEADELTAHTVAGNLRLRNLKGRVLDVNSVNGDASLVGVFIEAKVYERAGVLRT